MAAPSGSGSSAAKSLSGTLGKALVGSDRLLRRFSRVTKETRDAFELSPTRMRSSAASTSEVMEKVSPPAPADVGSDPFDALLETFPITGHPILHKSSNPWDSVDPLFLLVWSWRQCNCDASSTASALREESASHNMGGDRKSMTSFVNVLKRVGGIGEPTAWSIVRRIDELLVVFQTGAMHWNVLNGVGPLEESAVVQSIEEILRGKQLWQDRLSSVWRCALVHLQK